MLFGGGKGDVFHFNIFAFVLAFGIGMLYVYMSAPQSQVIVKYPTPFNAGQYVYKDSAGTCFVFKANKVECPTDKSQIKPQPIVD
jgi:hypothetical protein